LKEPARRLAQKAHAHGPIGDANELVGAAIYLISDSASYTSGETIVVDGGFWREACDGPGHRFASSFLEVQPKEYSWIGEGRAF